MDRNSDCPSRHPVAQRSLHVPFGVRSAERDGNYAQNRRRRKAESAARVWPRARRRQRRIRTRHIRENLAPLLSMHMSNGGHVRVGGSTITAAGFGASKRGGDLAGAANTPDIDATGCGGAAFLGDVDAAVLANSARLAQVSWEGSAGMARGFAGSRSGKSGFGRSGFGRLGLGSAPGDATEAISRTGDSGSRRGADTCRASSGSGSAWGTNGCAPPVSPADGKRARAIDSPRLKSSALNHRSAASSCVRSSAHSREISMSNLLFCF